MPGAAADADAGWVADALDLARARHFDLLALLLSRAPDAGTLALVAGLAEDPGTGEVAEARRALGRAATTADTTALERAHFRLFVGVGRGELVPYASYYRTGFLQDRPLARLRADLVALGLERAPGSREPEDAAATLLEIVAVLIDGRLGAPQGADRPFFEAHLAPWIERFFADLERAGGADFHGRLGALGRAFMAVERAAADLAA